MAIITVSVNIEYDVSVAPKDVEEQVHDNLQMAMLTGGLDTTSGVAIEVNVTSAE